MGMRDAHIPQISSRAPALLAWTLGLGRILTAGNQLTLRHVTHVDQQLWEDLAADLIRVHELFAKVAEVLENLQHYLETLVKYLAGQLRLLSSRRGDYKVAGAPCRDVIHQLSPTILVGLIDLSPVHAAGNITH